MPTIVNTRSTEETMRHIPDEELHAYLDQALSRSQCVEIESHLAACPPCQANRDAIAALRDQTTALLATLTPPRRFVPAFELLQERAAARSARRAERWRAAAWAASVLLAVGLGWAGQAMLNDRPDAPATVAVVAPGTSRAAVESVAAVPQREAAPRGDTADAPPLVVASNSAAPRPRQEPARGTDRRVETPAASAPAAAPSASLQASQEPLEPMRAEVSSGRLVGSDLAAGAGSVWRTLSWDGARRERGDRVPRIAGLPVVEVQMGQAKQGERPVVVVAQQLSSGEVIHTIEGPATDVSRLLSAQPGSPAASPWPIVGESGISGVDGTMAVRRGDRMLAITADGVPRDSLRAMIRRMNAEDR